MTVRRVLSPACCVVPLCLRCYIRYRLSMRSYFLLLGLVLAGAEASRTDQPSAIVAVRDGNLDVNSSVDCEVRIDGVPVVSA